MAVGVLVYRAAEGIDAIDEYCRRLERALRDEDADVRYVADGWPALAHDAAPPAWILLQYNPFGWGRSGFAPRLVVDVMRSRRTQTPLAIMVHEAWIEMEDARSTVIGAWQRLQLRALIRAADLVMTSTEALAHELGRGARHVPIAATITPAAISRADARGELGVGDRLVVALLGRDNPARALDHAEAAIIALAARDGRELTVLNLGAGAPRLALPPTIDVRTPGDLSPAELSHRLAACDLALLPFTDGVSTRRTTLMAALAHGLPVLGLHGRNTDTALRAHPEAVVLTPAGDPAAYARAAVELAADAARLRAVADAGRRLYAEQFDWPVIAKTVAAALAELTPRGAPRRPAG